jgi:hypothetical protein
MESHAWSLIETPLGRGKIYCIDTDGSHDGPMVSTERTVVQHLVDAHNASVAQLASAKHDFQTFSEECLHAMKYAASEVRFRELDDLYRKLKTEWEGQNTNG